MSDFEKWFRSLNANGKTVYFLGNEHKVSEMAWNHQQAKIDELNQHIKRLESKLDSLGADRQELVGQVEELQGQVGEALEEIQRALNCCESTETACVLGELVKVLRGES